MDMPQDSEAMGLEGAPEQEEGGYVICIKVDGQGALSVGVEPEDNQETSYAPAQSIEEALEVAKDIFDNSGQVPGAMSSEEEAAMRGYNKGAPAPQAGGMSPAKVFGE